MLLLYKGADGISRNQLLKELYNRDDIVDAKNNLRVTSYRLKKFLVKGGLPEYDYITVKNGIYRWNSPMEVEIDAHVFKKLLEQASITENQEEKIRLLKEGCKLYRGEFLKEMSEDYWVIMESLLLKKMYTTALSQVCDYLKKHGKYEEVLQMCEPACEMYPFDEWQCVKIECYIAMNRYKDAQKEYEATAKLFFEELGVEPSQKMIDLLESMGNQMKKRPQIIKKIKEDLKESNSETGPIYCTLPSFRDEYRLICRITERNGQSVYLMLCTITDGKQGGIIQKDLEQADNMAEKLYESIKRSLRRCDVFTRLNPAQFLAILIGISGKNCETIIERVSREFSRENKFWRNHLECQVSSIAETENDSKERHDM